MYKLADSCIDGQAQNEADELDKYRARLEKDQREYVQQKLSLDLQLGEINFKTRQVLHLYQKYICKYVYIYKYIYKYMCVHI